MCVYAAPTPAPSKQEEVETRHADVVELLAALLARMPPAGSGLAAAPAAALPAALPAASPDRSGKALPKALPKASAHAESKDAAQMALVEEPRTLLPTTLASHLEVDDDADSAVVGTLEPGGVAQRAP